MNVTFPFAFAFALKSLQDPREIVYKKFLHVLFVNVESNENEKHASDMKKLIFFFFKFTLQTDNQHDDVEHILSSLVQTCNVF